MQSARTTESEPCSTRSPTEVVETREVEDNDMMFGLCELTMYPLGAGLASLAAGLVDE